jgi:hypothetical protein
MSALGHKRTLERPRPMSALPPKADIETALIHQLVFRSRHGWIPLFSPWDFFRKNLSGIKIEFHR